MRPPVHIMFVLPRGNCIRSNSAQRARSRSEGQPSCYSHPGPVFETYTQLAWQSCTRHVGASRDRSLDLLCLSSTGLRHRSIARTTTSTTRGGVQQTRAEMIWDDTACMTHPSCGAERKVGRTAHWYHLSQTHTPITPGIGARSVSPSLPLRWLRRRMHARAVSVSQYSLAPASSSRQPRQAFTCSDRFLVSWGPDFMWGRATMSKFVCIFLAISSVMCNLTLTSPSQPPKPRQSAILSRAVHQCFRHS